MKAMILPLVTEPNPLLYQKSEQVPIVDDSLRVLMDDMLESMYHYGGVGLAAVQVGVLRKIIVIDVSGGHTKNCEGVDHSQGFVMPMFMVNAVITEYSEQKVGFEEGCLSFPGFRSEIMRPADITVKFLDYYGNEQEIMVQHGLLSVCIQHEVDHTNGKVFIDYLSRLKRSRAVTKVINFLKESEGE